MSIDTRIKWIIAGLAISVVFLIGLIYFGITRFTHRDGRPPLGERAPVETLAYCGAEPDKLCIVSFAQNDSGQMLIYFQTPNPYYPEFVLRVIHNEREDIYECERAEDLSNGMTCQGVMQVPGEVMDFTVISRNWGNLLAEGKFAIIGIALATPENLATPTIEGLTGTPFETPTAMFLLPSRTPTSATPSYPNPSYPNPTSYP